MDSLKLKFPDEESKIKFLQEIYPVQKYVESKERKLDTFPTALRALPYAVAIGAALHGIKTGWIKTHPTAMLAGAMLVEPTSRFLAEVGNRIIERKKSNLKDAYKTITLAKALKYNASFSVPSGEIKIG